MDFGRTHHAELRGLLYEGDQDAGARLRELWPALDDTERSYALDHIRRDKRRWPLLPWMLFQLYRDEDFITRASEQWEARVANLSKRRDTRPRLERGAFEAAVAKALREMRSKIEPDHDTALLIVTSVPRQPNRMSIMGSSKGNQVRAEQMLLGLGLRWTGGSWMPAPGWEWVWQELSYTTVEPRKQRPDDLTDPYTVVMRAGKGGKGMKLL